MADDSKPGKGAARPSERPCRFCGECSLVIRTTKPTAEGDHTAYLKCDNCLKQWKVDESLGHLISHCAWWWRWAGYGRQWLHLEYDGWPIDVQSRYLCIRKLDDEWGRGADEGAVDRHGRGWGRGDETGWFILTGNYLLLEEAVADSNKPMDRLIAELFNERLDELRENDRQLVPVTRRRKRRNKSQNNDK
ncbi:hypothetical protein [Halomonas sp.]|uniref:hypothetical protein n=1 Tax=Halomonas sp. TaxID=1486246 RepID=UPI00298EC4AF|nr:hypothetical protein [Halomonas sp.]MDW7746735.1 hypothetical protein [Halomonas sp.]